MVTRPAAAPRAKRKPVACPPDSHTPHRCVVLAVDPGAHAGWSVWIAGELHEYGTLYGPDYSGAHGVVERAQRYAAERSLPCVLVIERPFAANLTTAAGMGAARGLWLAAWHGTGQSRNRIALVYPATWRSKVLPKGSARMGRAQVQAVEQASARTLAIASFGASGADLIGTDSAPAVLIGRWASHAGAVAKKLPKRATIGGAQLPGDK